MTTMKRTFQELHWRFPATPTGGRVHTFQADDTNIATGARWCGDHGLVMELCKVQFVHAFEFQQGVGKWNVLPGGFVWDQSMAATATGIDEQYSGTYISSLTIGEGSLMNGTNAFRDGLTVAECRYVTTVDGVASSKNIRSISQQESGLIWDLTDSAGNGLMVASQEIQLSGFCRMRSTEQNRDVWPKRLAAPYGYCDVVITGDEYTGHPVTECHMFYRMKRVTLQDWYALTHDQQTVKV